MNGNISELVAKVIIDVKNNGDKALVGYTKRFDAINLEPKDFVITRENLKKSFDKLNKRFLKILEQSKSNIYNYHKKQKQNIKPLIFKTKGSLIKEKIEAIERVGVYIPGGMYPYPSSVFANIMPAIASGVKEVVVTTPLKNLNDIVKASLYITGVQKVFCVGGAQAIAALAYGTETIPKVDMIIGPGNKYIMEAKRQVFGIVGIDSLAGPSEVLIIADDTANPKFLAEDLQAQAEHDSEATAFLLSTSKKLINETKNLVNPVYKNIFYEYFENMNNLIDRTNEVAPEHLEIIVKNTNQVLNKIKNAGAIFVGDMTPVALGDYWLGPSHSLPTGKCAKFSSGLSVHKFLKRIAVMQVSSDYIKENSFKIQKFAESENLIHHAESIRIRK